MTEAITTEGTLEFVDPDTLVLETNVRTEDGINRQFVASIKENGVLVPIVAVRDDGDRLIVRAGQRRTLAAREAGLTSVPVYVTTAGDDTATRIVVQISENDHRLGLRPTERVLGVQQLLDCGLTPTKVAKRLAVSAERVKQSAVVAHSPTALEKLDGNEVTLAEAAGIAEFEDDERAVDRLLQAAGRNYFDHTLAQLRQNRELRIAQDAAAARYREQGWTVLDDRPRIHEHPEYVPLHFLVTAGGHQADLDAVTNPALWAVWIDEESVYTDNDTGDVVDEVTIDWNTEGKPGVEPIEGKRHADTVTETVEFTATDYYCLDPVAAGLTPNERFRRFSGEGAGTPAAAQEKVDTTAADKRERRTVLALNRAAEAAQTVRREFVTTLLSRKTPPKGAATFVAGMLVADSYLLSSYKADEITPELLGVGSGGLKAGVGALVAKAGDPRAQVIVLGVVLGALEGRTPKTAWRSGEHFVGPKEYLGFLAENGYTLSAVEKVMVGGMTADECFTELTHE